MVFGYFFLAVNICLVLYYLWYLLWPVVPAKIKNVNETIYSSGIRGARRHSMVSYAFEFNDETIRSNRQSLFLKAGLGPRTTSDQTLKVSVCKPILELSCPRRPFLEALVLLGLSTILAPVGLALLYL